MRVYMQTPAADGRGPRFYHLFIQRDLLGGWSVVREFGAQGSSGRLTREHFESWDDALAALVGTREAQVKRGYRVVFFEGQRNVVE